MNRALDSVMALLAEAIQHASADFVELRHHRVALLTVHLREERATASIAETAGVHVRVARAGRWGTSIAERTERACIDAAIADALACADAVPGARARDLGRPRPAEVLSTGRFEHDGIDACAAMPLPEKIETLRRLSRQAKAGSRAVSRVSLRYRELLEERVVATTDGACAGQRLLRPDAALVIEAAEGGHSAMLGASAGVAGGWDELWRHPELDVMETVRTCIDLMRAPAPERGPRTIILGPALTGLLAHEAVGHLFEYDAVHDASLVHRRRGQRIGSDLVHVVDVGTPDDRRAAGFLAFDDEGTRTRPVALVEAGRVGGYLHDVASALEEGEIATGNSRAWSCSDPPLIRMRNTHFLPGDAGVDELIASVQDGYLFCGPGGGQAESNGNVALIAPYGWRIVGGRRRELVRGATLCGNAAEVLMSVDAVSSGLRWAGGAAFCQRGQYARVDAGGSHLRCRLVVSA